MQVPKAQFESQPVLPEPADPAYRHEDYVKVFARLKPVAGLINLSPRSRFSGIARRIPCNPRAYQSLLIDG